MKESTDPIFLARVDGWVSRALADETQTFPQILRALPGVYPTAILAAVDRLRDRGLLQPARAQQLRVESAAGEQWRPCRRSLLPLPHPLDYEWRFSPRASRELLDLASTLSSDGEEIVLLGTPSVAHEAMSHSVDRDVSFLGPDNSVTRRLIALNRAMDDPLRIGSCSNSIQTEVAQVVIIDPPWYLDFVRPMMLTAAALCREGGFILASLPPTGARAKAALDRERLFRLATRLGLTVHAEYPLSVEYDTPFFEANALTAAGIAPLRTWRRGDLVLLRKRARRPHLYPRAAPPASRWREVQIRQMRLFIGNGPKAGETGLTSLIDGDILPTVSRRDNRRRDAVVWTSGNRIFGSQDTEVTFEAALQASELDDRDVHGQHLFGTLAEAREIERVADILRDLAAKEASEERAMRPVGDGNGGRSWTSAPVNSWSGYPETALG